MAFSPALVGCVKLCREDDYPWLMLRLNSEWSLFSQAYLSSVWPFVIVFIGKILTDIVLHNKQVFVTDIND